MTAKADRTLCVVVCGAGPAPYVGILIDLAHEAGWSVRLVATPAGMAFIDPTTLAAQTGTPVRDDYRGPGESGPRASTTDAVIVAPATYNTINKLAAGINDTYALNVVAEAIGRRTPVVILPFVNSALAARAPFIASVRSLRAEGVRVLFGAGEWEPHPPGRGDEQLSTYPWGLALATAKSHDPIS
jgi:phosphopantothenoylcysteine synthetase/decarboxylase